MQGVTYQSDDRNVQALPDPPQTLKPPLTVLAPRYRMQQRKKSLRNILEK
jgi:hypothetical protein